MNNESSLDALYADHHGWLLQWFRRRLFNIDQAADLTHDAFLRVMLSPSSESIDSPRGYLTVIARNLLANHYNRRQLEQAYLAQLASLPEAQTPSEEERAMVLESLYALDAMLNGLAPQVRNALFLSQLDGLSYAEIAKRLAVSERTVKRYMTQAIEICLIALHEQEFSA